jgi:hypothetical protein
MSNQEASQWLGRGKATLHRWIQQAPERVSELAQPRI